MKEETMPRGPVTRRTFLGRTAATAGVLAASGLERVMGQPQAGGDPDDRQRIERAIPAAAPAAPLRPRKLLIFDLNVNYGGHASIPTANTAFTLMGKKTGAFETVVSRDPAVFEPASLRQFDAVFFNNTVGNCFEDPALRQSLIEFVYSGGGLMGVHGTSVAFTKWPGAIEDWPEFGIMLGYRDEFFRVHEPYSRHRVRVLMSIDTARTDMQQQPSYGAVVRADDDYALAWVRQYGRGRVFYCTIAHHPSVFWDPRMLRFYLAATQFALGDLPAPTTPSAKLTPAVRAQERLGWRLNLVAAEPGESTFFETVDKASRLGMLYVGGSNRQKISRDIPKKFHDRLTAEEMQQIRLKLDAASVRLLTYHVDAMPSDSAGQLKIVEFARKMGIEAVVAPGTRIAPEGKLPQIVSLDEAARAQGIHSLLDETRRYEQGPVIFCVESGDDELERTIEAFDKAVAKPT